MSRRRAFAYDVTKIHLRTYVLIRFTDQKIESAPLIIQSKKLHQLNAAKNIGITPCKIFLFGADCKLKGQVCGLQTCTRMGKNTAAE